MAAKILVVDDDPNVQRVLTYTLKQEGYEVFVASDGAEGFRLWGTEEPDLILLDVMLPKLDGYQVATKIRPRRGPPPTSRSSCSPPSARSSSRSGASGPVPTTT